MDASGYPACLVAENLAWEHDSRGFSVQALAARLVNGWQASPPHRANLLLPEAVETGVGVARVPGGAPRFYAVQLFGRGWPDGVAFQVRNGSRRGTAYRVNGERQPLPAWTTMSHRECVPPRLDLPDGSTGVRPRDGERFVLQPAATGWRLRRE